MSASHSRSTSKQSTDKNTPSDAEEPFDPSARADIILRSSDSVDFYVLETILSLASPVFKDMFSSAQQVTEEENPNERKKGLAVIDLEEDSETLYNLLPLLYPYAQKPTEMFEVYGKVGNAAQKYAMDEIILKLEDLVMDCDAMMKEPVGVFAIAVRFGWVEVMREAARKSLAISTRDLISGTSQGKHLQVVSAADYQSLLRWRNACQDALNKTFRTWTFRTGGSDEYGIRRILGPHLRERLKETGCASSKILLDDFSMSDETMKTLFDKYSWRQYSNVRESIKRDIEDVISKVPLKINGILVQGKEKEKR